LTVQRKRERTRTEGAVNLKEGGGHVGRGEDVPVVQRTEKEPKIDKRST
jgi:hypothetical protein